MIQTLDVVLCQSLAQSPSSLERSEPSITRIASGMVWLAARVCESGWWVPRDGRRLLGAEYIGGGSVEMEENQVIKSLSFLFCFSKLIHTARIECIRAVCPAFQWQIASVDYMMFQLS
jgi:hypothetical protein